MIATVTLNPAVDKTYYVEKIACGEVNRVTELTSLAGGKGINVARICAIIGEDVIASGYIGGNTGRFILESLAEYGIKHDFFRVKGESRTCIAIREKEGGKVTEFLEPGPTITPAEITGMEEKIIALAKKCKIMVLAGSLPKGTPPEIYQRFIRIIKKHGAIPILDTSGKALELGIEGEPYMIKPEAEVQVLLGLKNLSEEEILTGIKTLQTKNIPLVVVSLGAKGSLIGWDVDYYRVMPPAIDPVNTVGCGDSLVAGIAIGISRRYEKEETIRFATAVSAANALTPLAAVCRPDDVERLLPEVRIKKL